MKRAFVVVTLVATSITCSKPTEPAAPASFMPQPYANLAQVMRGIPFTFSNIVFDAQAQDPGAPRAPAEVTAGATETFKNVYGGWQEVENSALALAEAANLLMIPGRFCENGKPVPVQDETYRKAAEGLAAAGRAAYKAAQSKNMDAMLAQSRWIAIAALGVVVGTLVGSRALKRIPEVWFRRVLALILALLGIAMLAR